MRTDQNESSWMTRYLVTGGAGFIGSHLVYTLLQQGHDVRVLDNLSTGKISNLQGILERVMFVEGDIRDVETVAATMDGVDYVLHQAALPSVPRSIRDPAASADVNITGTIRVLAAAKDAGVKRVVCASSSSVYGANPALPKREEMTPSPMSPYAVTKLSGEQFCQTFWLIHGLETVSLRYFNVFGPRQDPNSQYAAVIPKFAEALLDGRALTIHGDGTQSRDFTYIDNVVQANLHACNAPEAAGKVFNVACGERHTLLELIGELERACDVDAVLEFGPTRSGDVAHSLADISAARTALDYEPTVAFAEGVRRTVQWMMNGR